MLESVLKGVNSLSTINTIRRQHSISSLTCHLAPAGLQQQLELQDSRKFHGN
uniref:Uncharacterized protein n=1 Tax=Vitis vinifera TaxID=29760 RepID=F6HL92_VITVI